MFTPDPGTRIRMFSIPDPGSDFFHRGSRIRIKEFKDFTPKKWFLSPQKYDPGCSSRIPDPDPDFLSIPDPGVKKHLIPDPRYESATLICLCTRVDKQKCVSQSKNFVTKMAGSGSESA
jgi:hypothetical protein